MQDDEPANQNAAALAALEAAGVSLVPRLVAGSTSGGASWTTETRMAGEGEPIPDDRVVADVVAFCASLPQQTRPTTVPERLSAIVTDLLTLARAESSPEVFEREPHDLRWLAEESYRALASSAESKGVVLRIDLAPEPVPVRGDRSALRLVIDNLLDNAVKYTPSKGDVTVRVWNGDRYANLVVTDTGIGIAAHEQERIFERFYRVDKARSRGTGGTGLGLSIVRHVATNHHGEVAVTSREGEGSTFVLRLPIGSGADRSLTHPGAP